MLKYSTGPSALIFALFLTAGAPAGEFVVERVTPRDEATGVAVEPLIQVHTSQKFDPASLKKDVVSLVDANGRRVAADITGDLGGVVTLSPEAPLAPNRRYEIRVSSLLKSIDGEAITSFRSTFETGHAPDDAGTGEEPAIRFKKWRIDCCDGVCGLALTPNSSTKQELFAVTWDGSLIRYRLDPQGMLEGSPEIVLRDPKRRFLSIVCDPSSDGQETRIWLSHDSLSRRSLGPNDFSGKISRVTIGDGDAEVQDFVVGLPTGDHPATGLVFGPDGRLFVSQGALTMLGGKPGLQETALSAAVLAIDLKSDWFREGQRPLDVRAERPEDLDLESLPVEVFATGIREAYDLCWHSNGQLYAGVNMNDTNEKTPASDAAPAINVRPAEMLIRIVRGSYYGHPNPSRGEKVLLGGNPTSDKDPWEVPGYPVGTKPDSRFDPKLLIRDLEADRGPSADGCVEWTEDGPLKGRLLLCFYTATRGVHSYAFTPDGSQVIDQYPLKEADGRPLKFGAPLDIVYHPEDRLYVADFSAPERGDSGRDGGIWLVEPIGD